MMAKWGYIHFVNIGVMYMFKDIIAKCKGCDWFESEITKFLCNSVLWPCQYACLFFMIFIILVLLRETILFLVFLVVFIKNYHNEEGGEGLKGPKGGKPDKNKWERWNPYYWIKLVPWKDRLLLIKKLCWYFIVSFFVFEFISADYIMWYGISTFAYPSYLSAFSIVNFARAFVCELIPLFILLFFIIFAVLVIFHVKKTLDFITFFDTWVRDAYNSIKEGDEESKDSEDC